MLAKGLISGIPQLGAALRQVSDVFSTIPQNVKKYFDDVRKTIKDSYKNILDDSKSQLNSLAGFTESALKQKYDEDLNKAKEKFAKKEESYNKSNDEYEDKTKLLNDSYDEQIKNLEKSYDGMTDEEKKFNYKSTQSTINALNKQREIDLKLHQASVHAK